MLSSLRLIHATYHAHRIVQIILGSLCSFVQPITSYPGSVLIFFSAPCSQVPCVFFAISTAPLGPGLWFFSFMIISQTVGLLGWVISSSQGLYLNTGQHKQNKHIHIPNIHALCGIRTHGDPCLRASEESTCLRPLRYRDRHAMSLP
jgi:hypothetical protein